MSDEAFRAYPDMWSEEDDRRGRNQGWAFEPVARMSMARRGDMGQNIHARPVGYALMWVPSAMPAAEIMEMTATQYVAGQAALGARLYEKAWLFYCYLDLSGVIDHGQFTDEPI